MSSLFEVGGVRKGITPEHTPETLHRNQQLVVWSESILASVHRKEDSDDTSGLEAAEWEDYDTGTRCTLYKSAYKSVIGIVFNRYMVARIEALGDQIYSSGYVFSENGANVATVSNFLGDTDEEEVSLHQYFADITSLLETSRVQPNPALLASRSLQSLKASAELFQRFVSVGEVAWGIEQYLQTTDTEIKRGLLDELVTYIQNNSEVKDDHTIRSMLLRHFERCGDDSFDLS